jgi:hypothetical protein
MDGLAQFVQHLVDAKGCNMSATLLTKEEARAAVEAELFALNLTKPMSLPEKYAFCEGAYRRLRFQSKTDRLRLIFEWTDTWQEMWLPPKERSAR